MKSKFLQNLLRILITLLGAGVGVAITMGCIQLLSITQPGYGIPLGALIAGYVGMALVGAAAFLPLANRVIAWFSEASGSFERRMDELTLGQLVACTAGLICGMMIAALLTQILRFMGNSMFTTIMACILFVIFGAAGFTVGRRRSREVDTLMKRVSAPRFKSFSRKRQTKRKAVGACPKLLDTSVLIDGRILDVSKTGFIEGDLMVPEAVLTELRHIADSTDAQRRMKGRRGMDILQKLQETQTVRLLPGEDGDTAEVDVKLLRLAKKLNAAVLTGDYNLSRAAQVSGVKTLNLNELAGALRPAVLPGEELRVSVTKEGKEPGQGVAYLSDGTMVVIEGARRHLGAEITVTVTTSLQTSAGRMIFAKVKGSE